jgi:hypothetical protein
VEDESDHTTIIPISHRKTTLPTSLTKGDSIEKSDRIGKTSIAESETSGNRPRYIRVKTKNRESSRYSNLNPDTQNKKNLRRSDSALSHFSSIFQTDEIGLGQAVLQEVRTREELKHAGTVKNSDGNFIDRILSELEETVYESALGQRITSNNTGISVKGLISDSGSNGYDNGAFEGVIPVVSGDFENNCPVYTESQESRNSGSYDSSNGSSGTSEQPVRVTNREKALKRLIQQLEEHQALSLESTSSGFQSVDVDKSRKTSVTEIDLDGERCSKLNGTNKKGGPLEIHDSGCSCHDTSSEHGTVKSSPKLMIPAKEKKKAEKARIQSLRKKSVGSKSCDSTTVLSGSEDSRDLDEGTSRSSMVVEDSSSSVNADIESNASS